ncbi:MAG: GNAT family N-acetyltransferase [Hyphomicrobiaceae bacterium]|nr:GNAT family N-acetyltransferase [Hyphomicrobiaceae bacterium]
MLSFSVHDAVGGIRSLEGAWRTLEHACAERFTYFQSFDWCATLITSQGGHAALVAEPRVVTIWRGGRLVLLWPGMVTTMPPGVRVLSVLGAPHSQYCTALGSNEPCDAAVAAAFRGAIATQGDIDLVSFDLVPSGSILDQLVRDWANAVAGANETAFCQLDSYTGWADHQARLTGKQRRNRQRRRNKLAEVGCLDGRVVWSDDHDHQRLLDFALGWKRTWLKETGRVGAGLAVRGHDAFLAAVPGSASRRDGAMLLSLEIDGRPVAIEVGFLRAGHFYSYMGSFDWALRDLSPGKVAMEECQRWLIENGAHTYDLLGMPADYKASWTNQSLGLRGYLKPLTLKGRVFGEGWLTHLRPALKGTYARLPRSLRRGIAAHWLGA